MKPRLRSWLGGSLALICAIVPVRSTIAAELNEATITQIVNDVQLHPRQAATRAGVLNDSVPSGSEVHTGINSRAELTFTDQTCARLSANTTFNFNNETRNLDLTEGAMLLRVPKRMRGATITTGAVTAAINGATVIAEYHRNAYTKFISLEGTARVYLKRRWGESVLVPPGQMLITNPNSKGGLANPVDVDLHRLLTTSVLITEFPPLASQNLIAKETEKQQRAKSKKTLLDTNLVIAGKGTVVSLANPAQMIAPSPPIASSVAAGTDAIPSSNDVGTVETPPDPGSTTAKRATDKTR
ncbi:MAG TPA: FecR domain-containing protein [Pyrinomonadaceae bacterium]